MIIEFKQTPATSHFLIKLKDKEFFLKLYKRVHMREIVRLRLMKKSTIMFHELQELLFSLKDFWTSSDEAIYSSQDYFKVLNTKWK